MRKAVLIFPNTAALAAFVLEEGILNAEVNSAEQSLTAFLTDEQIVKASTRYSAFLKVLWVPGADLKGTDAPIEG